MGTQGVLGPSALPTGRLRVQLDKTIHKLNIDKTPLLKLTDKIGKESVGGMEFKWLSKERRSDWGTISSFGGAWADAAATNGTITVPADEDWMYAAGDLIRCPKDSNVNIYIVSVNKSTHVITAHTYDNTTTIDFSAGNTGANLLFNLTNSFELGSGRGTIKTHQPSENYNYIQIIQDPFGIVESMKHFEYEAGSDELSEQDAEIYIKHLFSIEKTMFFGQKHKATTGYMDGIYEQYFTGGLMEAISTNVASQVDLTRKEFDDWVVNFLYHAEKPIIFADGLIYSALSWWLGQTLQTQQSEKTLGVTVSTYITAYGDKVEIIPHRELFKNQFSGMAFGVDLADVKYKYLDGEDTHLEVGIQTPGVKQIINEYRTWFGMFVGNEKRHALLKDVATISA